MISLKNVSLLAVTIGLTLGISSPSPANAAEIQSLTDFYNFYGNEFNSEEQDLIAGIFDNIDRYLQPNGLDQAIADGFIPFTREWKNHGTHWFNPNFVEPTNIQANPILPGGLNIDRNGRLAGVFWAQELHQPIVSLIENLDLANTEPETLTELYGEYKQNIQPPPTIFEAFGDKAQWHTHRNVIIENLGAKNEQGQLDPRIMRFRQGLSNEKMIEELLLSLENDEIVLAPFEEKPSLGYPFFNRGISPGFYMVHMWVGLGNKDGLFARTNQDIPVSLNAIDESETFEQEQSIPEPSSIMSILGLALLTLKKLLGSSKNQLSPN